MRWEREFLGLAASWMLCRLNLITGQTRAANGGRYDPVSWQVGELDYALEMSLLLEAILRSTAPAGRGPVAGSPSNASTHRLHACSWGESEAVQPSMDSNWSL